MTTILRVISLVLVTVLLLASVPAQSQRHQTTAATPSGNTPGRIARFTTSKAVDAANITEDASGNLNIGPTRPTSRREMKQLRQGVEPGRQPRK